MGRDPYALVGATLGTVLLMALLSYAISADIEHIPIAIMDGDQTPTSRAYLRRFDVDPFFAVEQWLSNAEEAYQAVTSGSARGAIIVPPASPEAPWRARTSPCRSSSTAPTPPSPGRSRATPRTSRRTSR